MQVERWRQARGAKEAQKGQRSRKTERKDGREESKRLIPSDSKQFKTMARWRRPRSGK
jgi:hypothetical protein